jgi:hypothetical protein
MLIVHFIIMMRKTISVQMWAGVNKNSFKRELCAICACCRHHHHQQCRRIMTTHRKGTENFRLNPHAMIKRESEVIFVLK